MARGKGAGVGGAPSRGRRREPRRLALPRAPGASGFAAAPRPVPTPREARAFVPFEAFAAVRAGAAEVCGSGEARARRRREGRGRRQRVRSRDSTRAEARGGARRLGGSSVRASVWIEISAGLVRRGFGAKIRSLTARDAHNPLPYPCLSRVKRDVRSARWRPVIFYGRDHHKTVAFKAFILDSRDNSPDHLS